MQSIEIQPAQPEEARQLLTVALTAQAETAVETFAHVEFKRQVDRFSDWLAQQGATEFSPFSISKRSAAPNAKFTC